MPEGHERKRPGLLGSCVQGVVRASRPYLQVQTIVLTCQLALSSAYQHCSSQHLHVLATRDDTATQTWEAPANIPQWIVSRWQRL